MKLKAIRETIGKVFVMRRMKMRGLTKANDLKIMINPQMIKQMKKTNLKFLEENIAMLSLK